LLRLRRFPVEPQVPETVQFRFGQRQRIPILLPEVTLHFPLWQGHFASGHSSLVTFGKLLDGPRMLVLGCEKSHLHLWQSILFSDEVRVVC